jgi:hypothetical protein
MTTFGASAVFDPPTVCSRAAHVGAAIAASLTDEARLDIGQPDIIRPRIAADDDRVAAAVVGAIDQDAAKPLSRISAKVIFCGRSGTIDMIAPIVVGVKLAN